MSMLGPIVACEPLADGTELQIVPIAKDHLEVFLKWLADPKVIRYLDTSFPLTMKVEEVWYEETATDQSKITWSIMLGGELVGTAGIHAIKPLTATGTTGLMIGAKEHWRKGIASRVMKARAKYAFQSRNMNALYTEICVANEGSRRAAESAGYVCYGLRPLGAYADGAFHDTWLGCLQR
jgi:ribosomal-protein-alanine N-acetyltransferase